jgi:hypothetical protein
MLGAWMEEIWAVGDEAVNAGADHGAHPPNTGPMGAVAVRPDNLAPSGRQASQSSQNKRPCGTAIAPFYNHPVETLELAVKSARRPHLQLRQFLNIQLPVVIRVQPVEFCLHKAHELLLGDFAILVCIHEEE